MTANASFEMRLCVIYKQLHLHRNLIQQAPELTVDISQMDNDEITKILPIIESQTKAVIGYLLSLSEKQMTIKRMVDVIKNHYTNPDFWRNILTDYVNLTQEKIEFELANRKTNALQEGLNLRRKIQEYRKLRNNMIKSVAEAIKSRNLPIDGTKMFTNYLNLADKNPQEAWHMLITNPGFLSPIITRDKEGNTILAPKQAIIANAEIAKFVAKLKI